MNRRNYSVCDQIIIFVQTFKTVWESNKYLLLISVRIYCDIVVFSCTKQTQDEGILLKILKRLNVAFTRAKNSFYHWNWEIIQRYMPSERILNKLNDKRWCGAAFIWWFYGNLFAKRFFMENWIFIKCSVSNFTISS